MREYETIYLLKPDIPAEQISSIKDKVSSTIQKGEGHILVHSEWGKRKLAYDVKKCRHAYYFFLQYLSPGPQVAELERILKYDDNVLKFLTVKVADLDDVQSRLATPVEPPPPPEELYSSFAGDSRGFGEGRSHYDRRSFEGPDSRGPLEDIGDISDIEED